MAAGEPEADPPRVRLLHGRADRVPVRRLVQLPAAVAGDLPHRSRALRVTRRARGGTAPAPPRRPAPSHASSTPRRPRRCSSSRRSPSTSARRSPCCCSTRSRRRPSPGSASSARRSPCSPCRGAFWRGWTRRQLAAAAVFGIATAAMNTFFYLAIDRTDLGKSVAIEFIGPIAVAAVMTRTRPQRRRPGRSPRRRASCSAASSSTATPPGWPACSPPRRAGRPTSWSAHASPRHARASPGSASAWPIGAVVLTPFGAPGSGAVWASPRLLVACLARRRVLQRHRLRHRPARPAADPGAPLLGAARPAAGHRRGHRLARARPAAVGRSTSSASPSCSPASLLQEREELAAELAAPDPS